MLKQKTCGFSRYSTKTGRFHWGRVKQKQIFTQNNDEFFLPVINYFYCHGISNTVATILLQNYIQLYNHTTLKASLISHVQLFLVSVNNFPKTNQQRLV